MNGSIVHHIDRTHGLVRDVYSWRCPTCRTRVSAHDPHTASVYVRRHECQGDAA